MKSVLIASAAAIILVSLIFQAAICGWFGLSLRNEVRPLEAVTLATNLLIAFFLQRFITTRINDLRAEKNVLIDASKEIIRLLCEVRERTDSQLQKSTIDEENRFVILAGFRRVANAITDLEENVAMSHLGSIKQSFPAIWSRYYALKSVATGGGFPTKGYSIPQRNSQELLFRALKTKCRRLVFTINDAQR